MGNSEIMERLEDRRLFSAAPKLFDFAVVRDRLVVHAELLKFKLNVFVAEAKLAVDFHRIKKETPAGDTSLQASTEQLSNDAKALGAELKADRLTEQTAAVTDEATIKLDIIQIKKDKGNTAAISTDRMKLNTDRGQLQTDLLTGLDARITARQSFEATVSDDTQAIVTASNNDAAATAALKAAVAKFAADRITVLTTLTADLQSLATARQQLANDLVAQT